MTDSILTAEGRAFWARARAMREFEAPYLAAQRARVMDDNAEFMRRVREQEFAKKVRTHYSNIAQFRCGCGVKYEWVPDGPKRFTCECGTIHVKKRYEGRRKTS